VSLRVEQCTGVWVPIVTPFEDEALALDLVPGLVERQLAAGVRGFLALGTTGEAAQVGDEEAVRVVRAVVGAVAGRAPVLGGCGRPAVATTLALGRALLAAGASGLCVLTPYASRAHAAPESLLRYYQGMASGAAGVPLFVYHMPGLTGLDLEPELLAELVSLPGIWGFKDSSTEAGPLAATLARQSTIGFVGSGTRVLDALAAGASGAILAVANVVPELCVALFEAAGKRDAVRAVALQERLTVLVETLRPWGPGGIKAALASRGWPAGTVRAPLAMPPEAARRALEAAVLHAIRDLGADRP
jgi:dihydrodipicolinate synthase/N-acetylneuraminate lyase